MNFDPLGCVPLHSAGKDLPAGNVVPKARMGRSTANPSTLQVGSLLLFPVPARAAYFESLFTTTRLCWPTMVYHLQ